MKRFIAGAVALFVTAAAPSVVSADPTPKISLWLGPNQLGPGDSITVPDVVLGNPTPPISIEIENSGIDDLRLRRDSAVTIDEGDSVAFLVENQPSNEVEPGDDTSFGIVFNPPAAGSYAATVTVLSDDPVFPSFSFTIKGKGLSGKGPNSLGIAFRPAIAGHTWEVGSMTFTRFLVASYLTFSAATAFAQQNPGTDALGSAPTQVRVAGVTLRMDASSWIDATNPNATGGPPLRVAAKIIPVDSVSAPAGLAILQMWLLLPDGSIIQAQQLGPSSGGAVGATASFQTDLAAGDEVRVVVELSNDGVAAFLGSPVVQVQETY